MSKPKMRYSDNELLIIKSVFADNEEIIPLLRKVLLQDKLLPEDTRALAHISDNLSTLTVFKKTLLPDIDINAPMNQIIDLWMTVESKDKTPEELMTALKVRKQLIKLIEEGLQRLENPKEKGSKKVLGYEPNLNGNPEEEYIKFIARNAFITHIEFQLSQMTYLAGTKSETLDELMTRLEKNSNK